MVCIVYVSFHFLEFKMFEKIKWIEERAQKKFQRNIARSKITIKMTIHLDIHTQNILQYLL